MADYQLTVDTMIKKRSGLIVVFALAGLVFAALPVFAQNVTTAPAGTQTTVKVETKAQIEARRAEMEKKRLKFETEATKKREERKIEAEQKQAEIQTRLGEMQAKRAEFQKENAQRKAGNTSKVILATIERLSNIADRVATRTAKLKEAGADTTESEGFMNAARADLEAAKASATAIVSLDLSGETAQENFEKIRVAALETKEHIRSAHTNLAKATSALSELQKVN